VEGAEAEAGDEHGRASRQALREPRLHVAPEEDLLGGAREDPHDQHGEEELGAGRMGERLADHHHAAVLGQSREHGQRVERLAEGQHPDDSQRERQAGLASRHQTKRGRRRAAAGDQRGQHERGRRRDAPGEEAREAFERRALGQVGIERPNDRHGQERERDDGHEGRQARQPHRPEPRTLDDVLARVRQSCGPSRCHEVAC
jgi:hypothetical protein